MRLKELQELVGFLQFCAQVIPHGRTFIHGLINFSMTFPDNFSRRHVPGYAQADIAWWSAYAWHWNGIQILEQPKATLHIYTDASSKKGLGGIFGDAWFSSRCPRRFLLRDIQFKEIYAVLQAIMRWGHMWNGRHIIFHVDSTPVVHALTSGTIQNAQVMNVLRSIVMLAAQLNFSYSSSWLASSRNALADAASHFEYGRLFDLAPTMQRKPCPQHPQLRGMKPTLIYHPVWHSSSGMASPPRPGRPIGQNRSLLQTSSSCIPNSGTQMVQCSQHPKWPCSNGLRGWEAPKDCNLRQSNHTSPTCGLHTCMPTYPSQHASPLSLKESYVGSKDTWASTRGTPSSQSPAMYSAECSRLPPILPCQTSSTSRHLLQQHSQVFLGAASSQC